MFQRGLKLFGFGAAALLLSLAAPAEANAKDKTAFSDAQKAEMNEMIHQFILENPEVLMKSVELYQQRQADKKSEQSKKASGDLVSNIRSKDLNVPYGGNPDAEFMIVEFLDYNCGYCQRGFEAVQKVIADKELDVKVAFVDLPVLGNSSREAAKFALAANMQDKYFEFHSALFEKKGAKSEALFKAVADELGLDFAKLKADANGKEVAALLERNRNLADELGISGTPAFIIGSEFVPGYIPFETMQTMISSQK
jgi:protein-disulfide isomerase